MNKPLIRYTIGGNPKKAGEEILRYSIYRIKQILEDKVDIVLCYNNISPKRFADLQIDMIDQSMYQEYLPYPPKGVAWKLYPPRLRLESHEIFIDNDFVLEKIPQEIDKFLSSDNYFFGIEGLHSNTHGRFHKWPYGATFNSGIFGIPPNFDFANEISKRTDDDFGWVDRHDEQGLVGTILFQQKNFIQIGKDKIGIFEREEPKDDLFGYHFVMSNYIESNSWHIYKMKNLMRKVF